jgi:small subunit ribosomal protein S1
VDGFPLVAQGLGEGAFLASDQTVEHGRDGEARHRREFFGQGESAVAQFLERPDLSDQADLQGFWTGDFLRAQDHVDGAVAADAADQTGAAPPGGDAAEVEFGEADLRSLPCGEAEVAGQGKFEAASEAVAEEGRDPRLPHGLDGGEHAQTLVEETVEAALLGDSTGELFEVHPDREVAIPGGGQNDRPDAVVSGDLLYEAFEFVHEGQGHPVVRGVVDGEDHDGIASLGEKRRTVHAEVCTVSLQPMPNDDDRRSEDSAGQMPPEEDFAKLLAQSEAAQGPEVSVRAGARVSGRVVALGAATAFVSLGGKSEGIIGLEEFLDPETGEHGLSIGDEIEATVTDDGSRSGSVVLKRTFGRGGWVPGELEQALEHGIAIEGTVVGRNKGGFEVQVAGQRAFCPASQIDRRKLDPESWVGQRLRFRVTRIDGGGRNIVLSRRDLQEEERAAEAASTWERLEEGAVVSGEVVSLREFGAFVDLGGVEGLIHISELGHGRVEDPGEVLEVGQKVEAQVVKIEPGRDGRGPRVGLSLRALARDPWQDVFTRHPIGGTTQGRVRRLESFGAFVELEPGLEGLVHVSAMALDRRVRHPRDVVSVGDEVEVTVVDVDPDKRRIGLSLVEGQRRERDAEEAQERREVQEAVADLGKGGGLGTFADLLAKKK